MTRGRGSVPGGAVGRSLAVAGIAVALLLVTAGPGAAGAHASGPTFTDPRPATAAVWRVSVTPSLPLANRRGAVFYAGDSLTIEPWAAGRLAARTWQSGLALSGVEAQGGILTRDLVRRLLPLSGRMPRTVLVAVGTNDVAQWVPVEQFRTNTERLVRALGARDIVFVTLFVRSDPWRAARERAFNGVLRYLDRKYRTVRLADWACVMAADPSLAWRRDPFLLHLSPKGIQRRTQFFLDAVCAGRGRTR